MYHCLSRIRYSNNVDEVEVERKTILTSRYVRRVPSASMMSMRWHLPYADVYIVCLRAHCTDLQYANKEPWYPSRRNLTRYSYCIDESTDRN